MTGPTHDLLDFLSAVSTGLAEEYERVRKRAAEDPGTAGDQGEENWAELLREWLPPTYQVVTKGRILGHRGTASPQVDVLVLRPSYPRYLLNKKLYLAAGVAAAFECKLTLKAEHIEHAVETCVQIKRLFDPREGTPYREFATPLVYGLLAHSHCWKSPGSKPVENILPRYERLDRDLVLHPREMLDIICVADLLTLRAERLSYYAPPRGVHLDMLRRATGDPAATAAAATGYHRYDAPAPETIRSRGGAYTTVGTFLCFLLRMLAWEDPSLRPLADYFRMAGVAGNCTGSLRQWPLSVFTAPVVKKLKALNMQRRSDWIDTSDWDEWAITFT